MVGVQEFDYLLAFATGVFGAFHCLGMCSGVVGGFFVYHGWRGLLPQLQYHGMRILTYTLLGVAGAALGRVLVQTGAMGKAQGILMMAAGVLIILVGLGALGLPLRKRRGPEVHRIRLPGSGRRWAPLAGGLLNGLVPCSLVFSVAVKAVAGADPLRAGLLMAAFGLGTLPTMGAVGLLGATVGSRARGLAARLAGVAVIALGGWTLYEGVVFYDVMRGLGNW